MIKEGSGGMTTRESRPLVVAVIDGMGGKIGAEIVARLRAAFPTEIDIMALGTNAVATGAMMKAKANRGASGENAVLFCLGDADVVVGAISVVMPDSYMGELTPRMAEAVATARVHKILLPVAASDVEIAGAPKAPLPHLMEEVVRMLKERLLAEEVTERV